MKKYPLLLLFISLLLIISSLSAHAQTYRFVIKVISGDRKEPIEGASIKIEAKSIAHSETRFETADWEGMAYREFDFYGTFTINAEAAGYYSTIQVVAKGRKDPSGDVPITLILKRKSGVKLVVVDVVEKGTGQLIYDARVSLKGNNYSYSGTTNAMGEAVIPVDHGDDFEITVSHNGYETKTGNLKVKQYDDTQNQYLVNFELAPTKNFQRVMFVKVQTVFMDGTVWSVPYANVIIKFEGSVFEQKTDGEGIVEFNHSYPPGELVMIDVSMDTYKSQSKTITIKASGAPSKGLLGVVVADGEKDIAVFSLIKEKGLNVTHFCKR